MPEMRQISFSDFLFERKDKFEPDNECLFKLDKIEKIDFSHGNIHLGKYKPTKTKQIIVEPDDFVFSGLNIEKGAVAINETGKRLVVSANYSTCKVDYSKIDKRFLIYFMRSQNFKTMLIDSLKKDYGFTRPKHLMPLTIAVPSSLDKQKMVIAQFQRHESEGKGLVDEICHQKKLLKKLRQQILQEAIEGKLTADWREQNPDVEPASELLARIKAEKEQLIKDKKIKKPKALPSITDDEKPFDLPNGWVWCRVWDIAQVITSGSRGWAQYYADSGAIFVTMSNLSKNHYDLRMNTIRYVQPPKNSEGTRTKLCEGDLLISITGDVGNLGLIPEGFGEAYINQHTCMLRFMPECKNMFFPELMRSPLAKRQFDAPQRGMKNSFRLGDVGEMIIPLPPLSEQKVIVAKVEKLFDICDQLEAQITRNQTHAEQLMQAVLKEAFQQSDTEAQEKEYAS